MIDDPDYQQLVETAHAWRERMGANDVSSEDVDEFDAWLHADFRHKYVFRQAQEYWAEVGQIGVDQLDDRLVASLATESSSEWFSRSGKKVNDTVKRRFKPLVVMAVLVVLVVPGIIFLYPPFTNTGTVNTADPLSFVSAKGEFSQQVLQDGSVINLSADTEVIVQFDANERLVVLNQGAVLFEVSHDPNRPFLVKTGSLTAEALGTVFEVRHNGGIARVGVSEGSVKVSYPLVLNNKPSGLIGNEVLHIGQKISATSHSGLSTVTSVNPERIGAWRQDMVFYQGATLSEVIADANRFSDTEITLEGIDDEMLNNKINVSFNLNDIDSMLFTLTKLYPVQLDYSDPYHIKIKQLGNN